MDTHPVHFHLFDVQVLNRVGWDGFIYLPDPNELGWKDTVRISPLEDTIVALRPIAPQVPFAVPNSIRPLNPAMPLGSTDGIHEHRPGDRRSPSTRRSTNEMTNFGHEYVWHCHILSHEESDMMRPMILAHPQQTLLENTTGQASIWTLDYAGISTVTITSCMVPTGDDAKDYHLNADGTSRFLWVYTTGQVSLWNLDASDNFDGYSYHLYGPYSGWTAVN